MADLIRDYQMQYFEPIENKIATGEKHISIVVPAGLGKIGIAVSFAKKRLSDNEKIAFVVNTMIDYSQILRIVNSSNELNNTSVLNIKDYLLDQTEFDYTLLIDLNLSARKRVESTIKKNKHSISFI